MTEVGVCEWSVSMQSDQETVFVASVRSVPHRQCGHVAVVTGASLLYEWVRTRVCPCQCSAGVCECVCFVFGGFSRCCVGVVGRQSPVIVLVLCRAVPLHIDTVLAGLLDHRLTGKWQCYWWQDSSLNVAGHSSELYLRDLLKRSSKRLLICRCINQCV